MNDSELYNAVTNIVRVGGYANSKGFLGFFESKHKHSLAESELTAGILLEDKFFGLPVLIHNVYLDYLYNPKNLNYDKQCEVGIARRLDRLIKREMVYEESETEDCSGLIDEFKLEDIRTITSVADMHDLMVGKMAINGLHGHCFGIYPQTGLVIYPHEDIGFGFLYPAGKDKGYSENVQRHLETNYGNSHKVAIWVDGKRPFTHGKAKGVRVLYLDTVV